MKLSDVGQLPSALDLAAPDQEQAAHTRGRQYGSTFWRKCIEAGNYHTFSNTVNREP